MISDRGGDLQKAPLDTGMFLVYSEKCVYLQSISGGRLVG